MIATLLPHKGQPVLQKKKAQYYPFPSTLNAMQKE